MTEAYEPTVEEKEGHEPGEEVNGQWFVEYNLWWCQQGLKKDGTPRRDKSVCKKCTWGENVCSDCGKPCCDLVMNWYGECPDCAIDGAVCRHHDREVQEKLREEGQNEPGNSN